MVDTPTNMKNKTSLITSLELGLIFLTGLALLSGVVLSGSESTLVKTSFAAYGFLFLAGPAVYLKKPRAGAALLIVALLSLLLVAPLAGFPVWVNGSFAMKAGLITGLICSAGILSEPLLAPSPAKI